LEEFVIRKVPSAINDVVEETLESTQKLLRKDGSAVHKDDIHAAALRVKQAQSSSTRGGSATSSSSRKSSTDLSPPDPTPSSSTQTKKAKTNYAPTGRGTKSTKATRKADDDDIEDISFDEDSAEETKVTQKRGRGATTTKSKAPPAKKSKSQAPPAATTTRPSRVSGRRSRATAVVYVDPEEDEDEEEMFLASGDESDALDDLRGMSDEEDLIDSEVEEGEQCTYMFRHT
jgi:hypothetical protein